MDFIAIDFETANRCRESACAIGLTYVENMKIVDQEYFLIKPTPFYFDAINKSVHGIGEDEVKLAPIFSELWTNIKAKLQNKYLVAHNASFDLSVLRFALNAYDLPFPDLKYGSTMQLIRKLGLPLENHKLSTLARYYNLQLDHHNALSDSAVCAQIAILLMKDLGLSSLHSLVESFGYQLGSISQTSITPFKKNKCSSSLTTSISAVFNTRNEAYLSAKSALKSKKADFFINKKIVLSGVFTSIDRIALGNLIKHNAGKLQTSVSSKTDLIIYGRNMGPIKKLKAIKLGVKMISEEECILLIQ